ncbi:hypothetical protein GCM10010297_22740 [Streptomyces malachitofuscus]|nr:hypothetical protein GCM10010297_22740 [Streptomyces malachitofuscus]
MDAPHHDVADTRDLTTPHRRPARMPRFARLTEVIAASPTPRRPRRSAPTPASRGRPTTPTTPAIRPRIDPTHRPQEYDHVLGRRHRSAASPEHHREAGPTGPCRHRQ